MMAVYARGITFDERCAITPLRDGAMLRHTPLRCHATYAHAIISRAATPVHIVTDVITTLKDVTSRRYATQLRYAAAAA